MPARYYAIWPYRITTAYHSQTRGRGRGGGQVWRGVAGIESAGGRQESDQSSKNGMGWVFFISDFFLSDLVFVFDVRAKDDFIKEVWLLPFLP